MFDEPKQAKREDMVELLEELTLSTEPHTGGSSVLRDEHLAVDLRGHARLADRSRRRGEDPWAAHLVRIAPREFTITASEPLLVGDHYVLSFDSKDLMFASEDQAIMRCTGCAELSEPADTYRATLRPFVDIDLRRVLSGSKHT